ncbi:MAG: ABC transporter permease [Chthoniobacterales bacterium]|nr:ABC transporter permease [Chthoniobacterales bacterium]
MKALNRLIRRVVNFTTRRRGEERLREEIESHIAAQTEENIRAGILPAEAARQARVKFGATEPIRQDYRAEEGLPLLEDLMLDVRYALRVLWKSPAFTLVGIFTLALGIGANVVVFGVVNAVLLRPLDVSDPHNLYQLRLKPWTSGKALTTSYPAFEDYRQRNTTFSGLAGYNGFTGGRLRWGNAVKNVSGYSVTGNYFELLGVQPQLGRLVQPTDDRGPNSAPYMVLSDSLWRTAFNADPSVVGTPVRLGKYPFTVVGVAPARFHGTERFQWPDYWTPVVNNFDAKYLQDRKGRPLTVLGRLKPGVTPERTAEDLSAIAAQLAKEYPTTDTGVPLRLVRPGLQGDARDVIRGFLYGVTGLTLLVLVAACANLASLFAARAADRNRELALRVALGASRWRLVRQLMTEAIVVSMLGGAAGLVAATLLLGALNRGQSPPPGQVAVSVDTGVNLAALLLTLVSGLLFGMIPARQVWQSSPLQAIKSGPADSTPRRRLSLRDLLLGAQIAICTLLVTASFVSVRGMVRMLHAPLGFQPQSAMIAEMAVSEEGDVPLEQKKKAMLEAVQSIPGVTAAGTVSKVPFTGGLRGIPVFPPGTTEFTLNHSVLEPYGLTISPGYFETAGTRLLSGRDVSWHDTAEAPHVAVVNATFARTMWGDAPAIGQRFIVFDHLREVVGIVEDSKYNEIGESPPPAFYLPFSQHEQANTTFIVRSQRAQNEMAAALERTLSGFAPDASIMVQSWRDAMAGALFPSRAAASGLGVMGLLAAMLAVTGIFGMAAYNVSRRMKELGIRVALGARTKHVISAAVGRPIVLLGVGSFAGLILCVLASRLLAQIVYQANPRDPVVVLGAVLTMALLGLAASAIPALRALAVDPSKLMRTE